MSDKTERRRLGRLTDVQFLEFLDTVRGELVVTLLGGYRLIMFQRDVSDAGPSPALIDEVNARRQQLFAFAEANTVRLTALGADPNSPWGEEPPPHG